MSNPNDNTPAWLQQLDAQNAQAAQQVQPQQKPTPAWLTKMDQDNAKQNRDVQSSQPSNATPPWLAEMDKQNAVNAPPPAPSQTMDFGPAKNFLTGLARVPGAIIGAPAAMLHGVDWLENKTSNLAHGTNDSTQDYINKYDPAQAGLDQAAQFASDLPFKLTGTTPYQPTTEAGRIGQAAVTGLGAGAVDPMADAGILSRLFAATKSGASASAAQGTQDAFPSNSVLPVIAALATHGATGVAGSLATGGAGVGADALRQQFRPASQGEREAGSILATARKGSPSTDGLNVPSAAERTSALNDVQNATSTFAPTEGWQAGAQLREQLQRRSDALTADRTAATAPIAAARDASGNPVDMGPVMDLISNKLGVAAGSQADAIQGAGDDLSLPTGNTRTQADQLAASRQAINSRIGSAIRNGDNATTSHLMDIRNALDDQVAAAVPEARQFNDTYAGYSRPLDAFQFGPVGKVLARDQFNTRYLSDSEGGISDSNIPDSFLRGPATRENLTQLVNAHGGDQDAALDSLNQFLEGKAASAVHPDGSFDSAAFDKAMSPYNKAMNGNVSYWFPDLASKFGNAKAAQQTLDTLNMRQQLANDVDNGALRDGSGAVTGASFNKWVNANADNLAATQSPGAVMHLKAIGSALQSQSPGDWASTLRTELGPMAAGVALGGSEGGVLAALAHKATGLLTDGPDAKRQAAFSSAIERAVQDPDYAAAISKSIAEQQHVQPGRALARALVQVPVVVNSTTP